jgi:hypothetical protein
LAEFKKGLQSQVAWHNVTILPPTYSREVYIQSIRQPLLAKFQILSDFLYKFGKIHSYNLQAQNNLASAI